ncbi:hypothetical protein ATCC90586_002643 [Pythium insidiosum]|nr:hypothetical protein ATCC90586_002643 [Pythium insidiosum]
MTSARSTLRGHASRRPRGQRRALERPRKDSVLRVPSDVLVDQVAAFLGWRETSAMACACRAWHRALQAARARYVDWRVVRARGDAIPRSLDALEDALRRDGGPRYPPTVMVVTLAFGDARDSRHAAAVWGDLVDRLERARLVPPDCVLVGLLQASASAGSAPAPAPADGAQELAITMSMGYLGVDAAAFERKELRWSASGLTDVLPCPWPDDDHGVRSSGATDSFVVLSSNRKAAQSLLALTSQWFPGAERRVVGGVLGPADSSTPLMLYRSRPVASARARKSYATRQRRRTEYRTAPRPTFPCSLLLRLRGGGDAHAQPYAWCSDRPVLNAVLRCNRLMPRHAFDAMRGDLLSYDTVSVLRGEDGHASTQTPLTDLLNSIHVQCIETE